MKKDKEIIELLKSKAVTKQQVYRNTKEVFADFQKILKEKLTNINNEISDEKVKVVYSSDGNFEAKLKFSGDTLLFHMHSNVFDFEKSHQVHQTSYVKDDKMRSFCGVINIYNFLSDSLKYNRLNDAGFLIARVFINMDNHFFVEGDKQLGFLFNDFINQQLDSAQIDKIVNAVISYSLNFDLQTPNFNDVKLVSVHQILDISNNHKIKTSKRLGFKFSSETNND